jgi:hypothetical protein
MYDAQKRLGNKWTQIAGLLPGRSEKCHQEPLAQCQDDSAACDSSFGCDEGSMQLSLGSWPQCSRTLPDLRALCLSTHSSALNMEV